MRDFVSRLCYFLYLRAMGFEALFLISVRRRLLDRMLGRTHKALFVFPGVFIEGWRGLTLGDGVSINRGCNLSCEGGLTVGDNVAIGHGCTILTNDHGFALSATPIKYQPVRPAPVQIGSNVWIGANVTILSGVMIAPGTVIAAGSVVTRSVETADTVIGGVPARLIKARST